MPTYKIEQYELHYATHYVEADSPARAIAAVLNNESEERPDPEYLEAAAEYGIPADNNRALLHELEALCPGVGPDVIDSIRSIEEVEAMATNEKENTFS